MALTTIAEFKAWSNITDSSLDTPLAVWLGTADAKIKRYTGLTLEQQAGYTEYVDGTDENSITLSEAPITAITSLKLVDTSQTVVSTYAASDYYLDPNALGVIKLNPAGAAVRHAHDLGGGSSGSTWLPSGSFPLGHGNILFTGDVGYETIPEDLKEAVWILMASSMASAGRDPGLASIGLGDASASFRSPKEAMESAYDLARPWRRL